ncbi:MAG: nickel pincer cofactor biosynthesis protein LarC [Proteobacteria bacterium]|nr:nickel pincer cofactor biosynthesis protein LarC [Pseudomonadota bacterium]MBU4296090.1 nickel pincer cofactor biosynthesis protein LarC [Pseudomonadota bacterium]MCG2748026.1 nickel pincer cofactor biosynthesis protein LarC [Desulfobulbaceae bacterium]
MIVAYADAFSGISGDMFLGALLDAGLPEEILKKELAGLALDGYQLQTAKTEQHNLAATKITITINHGHHHRTFRTIKNLLEKSTLHPEVKEKSLAIFSALAQAEAQVHGCPPDEVHFHEVGAVDAIIDIVGASIGLHYFGIEQLIASPLPLSQGWVECAHGRLPLPAPAVCELVKGMPVYGTDLAQELVTPTGAAILKGCGHSFGPFPSMTIEKVGYGAGSHKLADHRPNLLRLVIGTSADVAEAQEVEVIETHLDDWQPEGFPFLSEQLFAKGALDVAVIPMQMKKGRPGFLLRVVADPATAWELKRCILFESSAIGLRFHREQRWTLPRTAGTVATSLGEVAVKKVTTPAGDILYPEYEDCRRLALEKKIPLQQVYREVGRASLVDFRPAGNNTEKESV